jgi:hypothetical protein
MSVRLQKRTWFIEADVSVDAQADHADVDGTVFRQPAGDASTFPFGRGGLAIECDVTIG